MKLTKNIHGQKQAGRVWNKYLDEGLGEISFKPSKMDPCLYFRGHIALLAYIDDCIMFGPNLAELDKVVMEMSICPVYCMSRAYSYVGAHERNALLPH